MLFRFALRLKYLRKHKRKLNARQHRRQGWLPVVDLRVIGHRENSEAKRLCGILDDLLGPESKKKAIDPALLLATQWQICPRALGWRKRTAHPLVVLGDFVGDVDGDSPRETHLAVWRNETKGYQGAGPVQHGPGASVEADPPSMESVFSFVVERGVVSFPPKFERTIADPIGDSADGCAEIWVLGVCAIPAERPLSLRQIDWRLRMLWMSLGRRRRSGN